MKSLSSISFLGSPNHDVMLAAATRGTVASYTAAKKTKTSTPKAAISISDPASSAAPPPAGVSGVPQEAKRRAPSAYMFFVKEFAAKNKRPESAPVKGDAKEKAESMLKLAGIAWKKVSSAEKQRFVDLAAANKAKLLDEGVISAPEPRPTSSKPLNGYLLFCQETRPKHTKKLSIKELAGMWAALDDAGMESYQSRAKKAMDEYKAKMETPPSTPPPVPPAAPAAPATRRKK